jgi:hypothetical protein
VARPQRGEFMRVNKWKYIFVIVGRSSWGREDVDFFDTLSETRKMLKEYVMAYNGSMGLSIIKRRVLND